MAADNVSVMITGFTHLLASQVATRLVTFCLTLITARLLTVEGYGLASVQFHLINTVILLLSREGFRRGCLRADESRDSRGSTQRLLATVALSFPLGTLVTTAVCAVALWHDSSKASRQAVFLQGAAAMLELAAEPLFVLAQSQLRFRLRVAVEASANIAKAVTTLFLLKLRLASEVTSLCLSQVAFAAVILAGHVGAYSPQALAWLAARHERPYAGSSRPQNGPSGLIDWHALKLCSTFTLQAGEKLVLAEGSKMVMVFCQSSYNQGVYGLVVNLGSLVVRTVLQPYEEAAFLAFGSQKQGPGGLPALQQRMRMLSVMVRAACVIGLLAAAFGPAYAYIALRTAYGVTWSETEAPIALAVYSVYIALLAVNGILEAFQHSVASPWQLARSNAWLVGFSLTHLALSGLLVGKLGAVGLICADSCNMCLRIAYSLWFVRHYCFLEGLPEARLRALFPSMRVLCAFLGAFVVTSASNVLLLAGPGQLMDGCIEPCPSSKFWMFAGGHVGVGAIMLVGILAAVVWSEQDLLASLQAARHRHKQQ